MEMTGCGLRPSSTMSGHERHRSIRVCLRCSVGVSVDLSTYLVLTFLSSTLFLAGQSGNARQRMAVRSLRRMAAVL